MNIGMAGAGLSCATIARELSECGHKIEIFERRGHVAGNCHTERDPRSDIMLHMYGPHIFHTDDDEVWAYVNRYMEFRPYVNRVKATTQGRVFTLPINLLTINQYFGKTFSPREAIAFIASISDTSIIDPKNFEEQALRFIGPQLYEAFFKGYTAKQWGVPPSDLPASILKRLPVRFDYNDNYFFHRHQGMPADGYTVMVQRILDHPNITIHLNASFSQDMVADYDHVFYSGTIDGFYDFEFGRLPYRTLDFQRFDLEETYQGCAVMNYCDQAVPFTRITEHKYFAPWESHERSVCYREFSRASGPEDVPYYPIHLVGGSPILKEYTARGASEDRVTFVGRLGTYRYMDMDVTIRSALDVVKEFQKTR